MRPVSAADISHHFPMDNNLTFIRQLRWLITLRWIGIGIAVTSAAVAHWTGFISSPAPVYGILCIPLISNLVFSRQVRHGLATRHRTLLAQIIVDQLTLAAGMVVSGACHSPLLFFFLFHVVISGILLPSDYTILVAALAALMPLAAVGVYHNGLLPSYDIFNHDPSSYDDWQTILTHGVSFFITLLLTTYFTVYLSRQLQRSREDLAEKNRKLSALVNSSRSSVSLKERNQVSSESFRAILKDRNAAAEIVLLDTAPGRSRCSDFFGCTQSNCPAYETGVSCWDLEGTHCKRHVPALHPLQEQQAISPLIGSLEHVMGSRVSTCFRCAYFAQQASSIASSALHPQETRGLTRDAKRDDAVQQALRNGLDVYHGSGNGPGVSSAAFPLTAHNHLSGLLFLSSPTAAITKDMLEFLFLFSELTSSALFGENVINSIETSYLQTVMALANAIEAKDPYIKGHSERVASYSVRIADAMGLTRQEKEHINFAAILHDVGKIGVSEELLMKTARLTGRELEDIQAHPEIGARILEPIHFLKPAIAAIRHHHENYDGSGYPSGMKGARIPLKARIVAIADAWDAMTSHRPYRKALSHGMAVEQLARYSGTQFDPELVEVFLQTQAIQHESA